MDVRCERCLTVYEFDDSQVGEGGVTVKCMQCGNLFKVRRRSVTGELPLGAIVARNPAHVPPAATPPPRTTQRGIPAPDVRKTIVDEDKADTLPPVAGPAVHRPTATTPAKASVQPTQRQQPPYVPPPRQPAPHSPPRQSAPHSPPRQSAPHS